MPPLSIPQLLLLFRAYSEATGLAEATIGDRAIGHGSLFDRLKKGKGANILTLHRLLRWFADNWPEGTAWPEGVPQPEREEAAGP